jgi:3-oxoadipate enol-lactonase
MPFATVNGIELYHELSGPEDGPPLLYIGGSGQDLRHQPVLGGPLADHFRMAAYDQRCLGQSGWGERHPEMADYAADAAGLLDHLGWPRAAVMGVSFGGMVAQELAVTWPERVERMVLACTSPGGAGGASYPLHTLAGLGDEERARVMFERNDTRGADAGPEYLAVMRMLAESRGFDPASQEGMQRQLLARSRHDVHDRLPRLTMPVLVAAGRYDGVAPPENQEAMHARIPGSRLEWFEGGHLFLIQDPKAWPTILSFLLERGEHRDATRP